MCPVELGWRGDEPASLLLLPIETRLEGLSLGELRAQPRAWRRLALDIDDARPARRSRCIEVTRTEWVTEDAGARARLLGRRPRPRTTRRATTTARSRCRPGATPSSTTRIRCCKQGLVVLDTPGLNAIGAEPELTLSLLPSAHATVFILGADTGVTKSDLAIWRDHLGAHAPTRFVVLNKIDALDDPLRHARAGRGADRAAAARDRAHARRRRCSACSRCRRGRRSRRASAATTMGLDESRLPMLEDALGAQLLPQRRQVLEQVVQEGAQQIENHVARQHRRPAPPARRADARAARPARQEQLQGPR